MRLILSASARGLIGRPSQKTVTKKNPPFFQRAGIKPQDLAATVGLEAVPAVYGPVSTGLEGHLGGAAAAIADHFVHLTGAIATLGVPTGGAAGGAAAGLVLEALLSEELLLRGGEDEFCAAVTASEGFVLIHGGVPPDNMVTQTIDHSFQSILVNG